MRASCEDGKDFIRSSVVTALEQPFPAYTGPKPSKAQLKEKRRKQGQLEEPTVPSQPEDNLPPLPPPRNRIAHFVMNLPDSAITFLGAFRGLLISSELREVYDGAMPIIHCHCFTRELELEVAEKDIRQVRSSGFLFCGRFN